MIRRLRGVVAIVALALIVVGAPILLFQAGRRLGFDRWPGWAGLADRLSQPDNGQIAVGLVLVAGWLAWAYITTSITVEAVAWRRARPLPRWRLLRPGRAAARVLVAAAAGLFFAVGPAVPSLAAPLPPPTAGIAAAVSPARPSQALPSPSPLPPPAGLAPAPDDVAPPGPTGADPPTSPTLPGGVPTEHVVVWGETLSAIAQADLGDANRWPELFAASRDLPQPTGWPITDPDEIDVGQIVRLPATGARPAQSPDASHPAAPLPAGQEAPGPGGPPAAGEPLPAPSPTAEASINPAGPTVPTTWAPTGAGAPSSTGRRSDPAPDRPMGAWPTTTESVAPRDNPPLSANPEPAGAESVAPEGEPSPSTAAGSVAPTAGPADSASPAPADAAASPGSDNDGLDDASLPLSALGGVGSILAAGALAVVGRNRARQRWHRHPGQRPPWPTDDDAVVEDRLRLVENPTLVAAADAALRALVSGCADEGLDLPQLRAARLTDNHLQLFLTAPATLPRPWLRTIDQAVWTCPLAAFAEAGRPAEADATGSSLETAEGDAVPDAGRLPEPGESVGSVGGVRDPAETSDNPPATDTAPAPYPALVCVGQDAEGAHLLLDLEQVGVLGLRGDGQMTREAMAALTVELATSAWADDITVTTVGDPAAVEDSLQTGCLRHVDDLAPALEGLARQAEVARSALLTADLGRGDDDRAGLTALHRARVTGEAGEAWYPDVVVLAGPTRPDDRAVLRALVDGQPRVALAVVTTAVDTMSDYRIEFGPSGRAVLQPFGLPFTPQRLSAPVLSSIARIVALARAEPEVAAPVGPDQADPTPEPDTASVSVGPDPAADPVGPDQAAVDPGLTEAPPSDPAAPLDARPLIIYPLVSPPASASAVPPAPSAGLVPARPGQAATAADPVADVSRPPDPEPGTIAWPSPPTYPVRPPDAAPAHLVQPASAAPTNLAPAPYLRLLGPVDVVGATGTVEPSKIKRLTEYLAFLVLHPGTTSSAIDEALWPDRTGENASTRNTATSKLRKWLGQDPDGQPYLPPFVYDASRIGCDWHDWRALVGDQPATALTTEQLVGAWSLVRGAPFSGIMRRSYRWADRLTQTLLIELADVAHELARRRCQAKDFRGAHDVLAAALSFLPAEESLWRLRILACYASHDLDGLRSAVDTVWRVADELGCDLEPETIELIAQVRQSPLGDLRRRVRRTDGAL